MASAELDEFRVRFANLRGELEERRKQYRERDKAEAPRFNLFSLPGVKRDEVGTHSAFIADLLDPEGSHGQGDVLLELFLSQVARTAGLSGIADSTRVTDWVVSTEKWTSQGILDIVVRSRTKPLLLVIENKIHAADQKNQLERYRSWMSDQDQPSDPGHKLLLYLTLDGRDCEDAEGIRYHRLSYEKDIANWLHRSLSVVKPEPVRQAIIQYCKTILNLCGRDGSERGHMSMPDWKSEIMNFLEQPDNLALALEISDRTEELKDRLIEDFWKQLKDCVQHDDRANGWDVRIRWESRKVKDWALDAFPVRGMKREYLSVTVIEDHGPLSYGIVCSYPEKQRLGKPRKEELPAPLPGPDREWQDEGWWVAKRVILPHVLRDRRSLIEGQKLRLTCLAKEVATAVCELVQAEGKFIEDLERKAASPAEAAWKAED